MARFPDARSLAEADEEEVLRIWEGLGYYSRARNILKAAKIIMEQHGGDIPSDRRVLLALPGIGEYTASAVMSIAFGKPFPVLDANVRRIVQRLKAWPEWNALREKECRAVLGDAIDAGDPGGFNEALMELGQRICLIENPLCADCPLRAYCAAFRKKIEDRIPAKKKSVSVRRDTILLILLHGRKILIEKKGKGLLNGLWVIPGIKKGGRQAEKISAFIADKISDSFEKKGGLPSRTHRYTRYADRLHPVIYAVKKPARSLPEGWKWARIGDLPLYPCPSAYRRVLGDLLVVLSGGKV
jgi:A/G-specific adenine glycosylase